MMGGMMAVGMPAMVLSGLMVFAGVVLLVVWLLRQGTGQDRSMQRDDRALAALRDRFARGEIDRTEYEERRRVLLGDERRWP